MDTTKAPTTDPKAAAAAACREAFASFLFFFGVIIWSLLRGAEAKQANPWNEYADTLEWTLPSPPPEHTFEILPKQEEWDNKHAH